MTVHTHSLIGALAWLSFTLIGSILANQLIMAPNTPSMKRTSRRVDFSFDIRVIVEKSGLERWQLATNKTNITSELGSFWFEVSKLLQRSRRFDFTIELFTSEPLMLDENIIPDYPSSYRDDLIFYVEDWLYDNDMDNDEYDATVLFTGHDIAYSMKNTVCSPSGNAILPFNGIYKDVNSAVNVIGNMMEQYPIYIYELESCKEQTINLQWEFSSCRRKIINEKYKELRRDRNDCLKRGSGSPVIGPGMETFLDESESCKRAFGRKMNYIVSTSCTDLMICTNVSQPVEYYKSLETLLNAPEASKMELGMQDGETKEI